MAFYALIIYISVNDGDDKKKIAIADPENILNKQLDNKEADLEFVFLTPSDQKGSTSYDKSAYDAYLLLPSELKNKFSDTLTKMQQSPRIQIEIISEKRLGLSTVSTIETTINTRLRNLMLIEKGIDPVTFNEMNNRISILNKIEKQDSQHAGNSTIAYAISFASGFIIYMMMVIYGTQVMRGVVEEKTNRIAEVMVSSVKPFQLMMGKILGLGAVGLTQFFIWLILIFIAQLSLPLIFPEILRQASESALANQENTSSMVKAVIDFSGVPVLKIVLSFVFYFLGGYLMYAALFAAIGSAAGEDQQDSQQMVFPVMMPIIIGFVMMTKAIEDPNSTSAVFGSIFPLTSPIVMMGRVAFDVPVWQMIVSMLLLILTFLFFTWISAKIYRTGILMYGKKAGWKEMAKWIFRKSN
jgi:ABC-2 type transport system permease protein